MTFCAFSRATLFAEAGLRLDPSFSDPCAKSDHLSARPHRGGAQYGFRWPHTPTATSTMCDHTNRLQNLMLIYDKLQRYANMQQRRPKRRRGRAFPPFRIAGAIEHQSQQREVSFYRHTLCISTRYLNHRAQYRA